MIVRGNPAWNNELPDKYKGLFEDDEPEEIAAAPEILPEGDVLPAHLEVIRNDDFHKEMFAKLSDAELKDARKLCPFYRILRFFKRDGGASGA